MDENFDQLRRLLALKRYEAPPPGFFENFSTKVAARIASAEGAQVSWWQKLGLDFSFRPAAVCALGVVICGLLSAGVLTAVVGTADQSANALAMPLNPAVEVVPFGQLVASGTAPSSTDPVFAATRFDQFTVRAQPVLLRLNR
jgi:hypothetical protein